MTTATTGFDEHALGGSRRPRPSSRRIRKQAFEEFVALPHPVAGDRGVALHRPRGLRLRPAAVRRRAAGPRTSTRCPRRSSRPPARSASAPACRSSATPRSSSPISAPALAARGVWFGDLDRAPRERPGARRAAPARPRRDRPLEVHRPARRVPHGRHLPVRPARRRGRAAAADPHVVDADGRGGLPADAARRRRGRRGHLHRPVRLAGARAGALRRDRRDPRRPRLARPVRRAPGVRRRA